MAAYTWPVTLPTSPDSSDYSEVSGVLTLVSPMDAGPAKMRRRGQKPTRFNVSYVMNNTQIAALDTFIKTTLRGTARFDFPHPRTAASIEVRFIPSSDGEYYSISQFTFDLYRVNMQLEQMP